jgi:hypothetical protein
MAKAMRVHEMKFERIAFRHLLKKENENPKSGRSKDRPLHLLGEEGGV